MSTEQPWWEVAFGEQYDTVYAHRSDAAAHGEVAGLLPRLRAAQGPVCDACCGNGRHLHAMRAAGLTAVGFDFSTHLLNTARQRAQNTAQKNIVARADIRKPPFAPGGFAAVTVLFTAFGYFDDASNAAALAGLASMLRPAGWLVLDLPNVDRLRDNLIPTSERTAADGTVISEKRHLEASSVVKDVTVTRAGKVLSTWQERVRLYTDAELTALAATDFTVTDRWPSLRGPNHDDARQVHWLRRK